VSPTDEIEQAVRRPGEPGRPALRCLALLHGAACIGRFDAVATLGALARRLEIAPQRVHECALQVVAYGGYPRAIEALGALAPATPPSAGPPAGEPAEQHDLAQRAARGRRAFEAVYGEQVAPVRQALERLSPGLADWVCEDAYGRVLARAGLELGERELLAVAALALMALPSPLDSHVRGALRNGSTPPAVIDILDTCCVLADPQALTLIRRVRDRLHRTPTEP
jgi:4-carboxymuconolactone decarboxylase